MDRSGAARAVTVAIPVLLAGPALAVLAALAVSSPIGLEGTSLAWLPFALTVTLVVSAAAAAVAVLVRGLRDRVAPAIARFGASATVAGGGVMALTGPDAPAVPLLAASLFLVVAGATRRAPPLRDDRTTLAAAVAVLLIAEAAAFGHLVPIVSDAIGAMMAPVLMAAAAVAIVAALVARPALASGAAAALSVGAMGLLLDRDGSVESLVGIASIIASQLLALRAALEEDEPPRTVDERLPELAARLADAVLRFDGRLELRDWNTAATELLDLTPASTGTRLEDLLGMTIAELPSDDGGIASRRILGGLEAAVHRSGMGVTAVIRDPGATPEAEQLGNELRATIEELLRARRTIELQRAELERAATVDPLTGVASRGAILDRLRVEVAQARRYQHPLAVVLLDVDGFREINHAHGIAGGDAVLRELALRVRLRVREADALGRFGSDGFLAALPHTDEAGAAIFADALKHRLGLRPFTIGETPLGVTVSIGVATMRAGEDLDLDGLLARVEEALASARSAGGDRIALDRLHGLARLDDPHAPRRGPGEADDGLA